MKIIEQYSKNKLNSQKFHRWRAPKSEYPLPSYCVVSLSLHLPIMMSNLLTRALNFLSHSQCAFELKNKKGCRCQKCQCLTVNLKSFWRNFGYKLRAKVHKFRVRHDCARQSVWERRITGLNENGNINYTHCIVFVCLFFVVYANWDI